MTIYEKLNLNDHARIDRVVAKKQFYENGELSSADKKIFDQMEKMYWRYALKTENTFIQPFADEERDYPEIEVMEVVLREEKQLKRPAEIMFRSIPYPMLLFFVLGDKMQLWLGKLRKSQADSSRMTLTATEQTGWLAEADPFWEGLSLKRMPSTNFCALYEAWFDTVSRRHLTEVGISAQGISGEAARETMNQLQKIEQEITSLRGQLKKESQFNRKLEINTKLQKLKREKANIIEQGSGEI